MREVSEYMEAGIWLIVFGFESQVRTFNGIDLDKLEFKKSNGLEKVSPAGDLSGMWHDEGAETTTKTA